VLLQVTEAQQQWWGFKADNFDSVLLFKVGKFYEVSRAAAAAAATADHGYHGVSFPVQPNQHVQSHPAIAHYHPGIG
jgi:hypothetical protein